MKFNQILTISTCMAPNMDFLCVDLAGYIQNKLNIPVEVKIDIPWQERERMLDAGQINLCWLCGLPYVWKADRTPGKIAALVAPVMSGRRYQDKPVYYSDVAVHRESPFHTFDDLRGASWAYNEPGSHSGYGVVRYAMAVRGETMNYFGQVIESGAHQNSLRMILNREVDASAIDSTVLEMAEANDPTIASQIRVIETFGPSPIPPWVVSGSVPLELRQKLGGLLARMDRDPQGRVLLEKAHIKRFTAVDDRDYDPIREMARIGFGQQP